MLISSHNNSNIQSYFFNRSSGGPYCDAPSCCSSTKDIGFLKQAGIFKNQTDSEALIMASPNTIPFTLPRALKKIPIKHWKDHDRIWINT